MHMTSHLSMILYLLLQRIGLLRREKSVLVDYRKAQRMLGWTPRHRPMLDEVELYFSLWKARQSNTIPK
jgi:hypothetical protein